MITPNDQRALALLSPANLAVTFSMGDWHRARHLNVIDHEFRAHLKSDREVLIVKAPPRHGKSEFLSKWAPTWFLLRNPHKRIICATHTSGLARDHSRWVRDKVHELAPLVGLKGVDAAHSSANNWNIDGKAGGMIASGVGGSIVGYGADLFLIDDYVRGPKQASSERDRDDVWNWFTSTVSTRLSPTGKVVILSTQWHEDDLIGRLLTRRADLGFSIRCVTLQGLCEDQKIDPLKREIGEALWPERWPLDKLAKLKRTLPARWWNSLYQGRPGDSEAAEFPAHYFANIWTDDWPERFHLSAFALDPSKGRDAKRGDYYGGVFVGYSGGKLWVDSKIDREPVPAMMRTVARFCADRLPVLVAIEGNAFQELLARDWSDATAAIGYLAPDPILLQNNTNKVLRIERLGTWLERREIVFRRTASNELLVRQLREFPGGKHDDGPDALEMAIRVLTEAAGAVADQGPEWSDPWQGLA
jgi:predicted phage terminase large subunit-like protein